MDYREKREVMSILSSETCFKCEQLEIIEKLLEKDQLDSVTILTLNAINIFEEKGFLRDFYDICKKHGLFPKWLENVEKGIDHV